MLRNTAIILCSAIAGVCAVAAVSVSGPYPQFSVTPSYRDPNAYWDDPNDVYRIAGRLDVVDVNVSSLTASRLAASDPNGWLVSTDAASWLSGTANQVVVTDDADGTVTLSLPQDVNTTSEPNFAGLDINGVTVLGEPDSNYTEVDANGFLTMYGTARFTNERGIDSGDLSPGVAAAALTSIGNYPGYAFTIGDDMIASFSIPSGRDSGEDVTITIYWAIDEAYAAGSGEVQWQIAWSSCPADSSEALDAPGDSGTIDYGDQDIPATAKYQTTSLTGSIAAASLDAGDLVGISISRVALDDGSDPTAEPVITHIKIEWTANTLGGRL